MSGKVLIAGGLTHQPDEVYLFICLLATSVYICYDYQAYPDLFLVLPLVAIICGRFLDVKISSCTSRIYKKYFKWTCLASLGLIVVYGPFHHEHEFTLRDQEVLARQIGQAMERGKSVYAVHCVHLLAMNRVDNYVKYGLFSRGWQDGVRAEFGDPENFLPLRNGRLPDVVITGRASLPGQDHWMRREYAKIEDYQADKQRIRIFVKNRRSDPIEARE